MLLNLRDSIDNSARELNHSLKHGTSEVRLKGRSHMSIGMTTGLQTYANYLAAHWLTVYQWS